LAELSLEANARQLAMSAAENKNMLAERQASIFPKIGVLMSKDSAYPWFEWGSWHGQRQPRKRVQNQRSPSPRPLPQERGKHSPRFDKTHVPGGRG
jgi:hypothetical protein